MTNPDPPSPTELQARITYRKIDAVVSIGKTVIKFGALVWCAFYAYKIVAVLAGKTTFASLIVSILANVKVSDSICVLLAGGGSAYGLAQRSLRRKTLKRLTERPKELEEAIDAKRSSSNLTLRGTTRPEDKS